MATRSTDVLAGFAPPVPPAAQRAVLEGAGVRPVEPRPSASVVLLRDAPTSGVEVYLLHRHARMPFAPSVAVFPGGGVDAVDGSGADAVRACARRETAEETTVVLPGGALVRWARWITPAREPRRYDTTFYLARLPQGQEAHDVSGETEHAAWVLAADALAGREAGRLALMPPTWSILLEVAAAPDVATLLAAGRDRRVETVLPRAERTGDGWRFVYEVVA
ncbi:NUDIX hydrolase [Microlunatus flavus]|uniref:NUDIX hydrolase n=1 Tax=Microlunatus flavus TaxID=1036181 RepID=UPI0018E07D94|nr:NUDIX hydrolase [Microlunatus flavus]